MKLCYSPFAYSLSPHIALREAGLDFDFVDLVKIDPGFHSLADSSDFTKTNPKAYILMLELDDGRCLIEGPVIVQYIADLKLGSGLAPKAGPFARYQLQEWLNFTSSEIQKGFDSFFRPTIPDAYKAITPCDGLAHRFAYLFVVLGWGEWTDVDIRRWPALLAFQERVGARSAVKAALAAETA